MGVIIPSHLNTKTDTYPLCYPLNLSKSQIDHSYQWKAERRTELEFADKRQLIFGKICP